MSSFVPVKLHFEAEIMVSKDDWDFNVLTHQVHVGLDSKLKSTQLNHWLVGITKTTLTSKGKSWKN